MFADENFEVAANSYVPGNSSVSKVISLQFRSRRSGNTKLLHRGEHLYRMGDSISYFYVVRAGSIRSYVIAESGEHKIIDFALPGDVLGFDALADGTAHTAAEALDTTSVDVIPFNLLFSQNKDDKTKKMEILSRLSASYHRDQELAVQISSQYAKQRLAWFLLRMSNQFAARGMSATSFTLPVSRNDIANYLGLAVETVSREFSKLCADGLIKVANRAVEILDMANLRSLVCVTMESAEFGHCAKAV